MLTEPDLNEFYVKACGVASADELKRLKEIDVIKKVVEFVRNLQSVDNLDEVGTEAFGYEIQCFNFYFKNGYL